MTLIEFRERTQYLSGDTIICVWDLGIGDIVEASDIDIELSGILVVAYKRQEDIVETSDE